MRKEIGFEVRRYSRRLSNPAVIMLLLSLISCCSTPRGVGPQALKGYKENVSALVTTSVRGHIRGDIGKQELLKARLPSLEKKATLNELIEELKGTEQLKELSLLIPKDVMFELGKPENREIKEKFEDSSEIQREVVSAITAGMRRALKQLGGD
jgi:hypothetical protein